MNIDQFRRRNPEYDAVPDAELASRFHSKYYANKMSFNDFANQIGVTVGPQERGFFAKMGEAYSRGKDSVLADIAVYDSAATGIGNEEEALRIRNDLQYVDRVDPISSSFLGDVIYGNTRVMGQWFQSGPKAVVGGAVGAVVGGAVGAGAAVVAGQLGPQVATPEELVTVPAAIRFGAKKGFQWGMRAGAGHFMYKQGTGAMYANMLDQGVPKEKALKIAGIAGIPYALVEVLQMSQFIKLGDVASKKALQEITKRTTTNIMKRLGIGYMKKLGTQVGEEVIQDVIEISAEDIAQVYSGYGIEVDATYLKQRVHRLLITAKESAKAMALLPLPGTAFNLSVEMAVTQNLMQEDSIDSMKHQGYRSAITEEQLADMDEDQRDAIAGASEAFDIEIDEALEMVQNFQHYDLALVSLNEETMKHDIEDARNAIDPVENTGEILGLSETNRFKKDWNKFKDFVAGYDIHSRRVSNILHSVDSTIGKEHRDAGTHPKAWKGVLNNLFWKGFRAATSLGAIKRMMATNKFRQAIDDSGITVDELFDKRKNAKYAIEVDGKKFSATEALEVYMAKFDKGKLRHLQVGNKMTTKQMNEVISQMDDKVVGLGDWMLQEYADGYESISKVYNAVTGNVLPQHEGYSRIFVDEKGRTKTIAYEDLVEQENSRRGVPKRDVKKGPVIPRKEKAVGQLRLDAISNFHENAMQVEWYKAVAPMAYKAGKIASDPEFQKRLDAKTRGWGTKVLQKWIQDIASERTTLETTYIGTVLNVLRKNSVVAALGFNVLSMMRQPLSTFIGIADDPRLIGKVIKNFAKDFYGDSAVMRDMVYAKSPTMRTRSMERELRVLAKSKTARDVLGRHIKLAEISLAPIKFMDQHTVVVVWKSAYELGIEDGMSETDAISYADGIVEKTQPMADIMDLPAFFRGSAWEKSFSTFQNQINKHYNYWRDDIVMARVRGEIGNAMVAYKVLFSLLFPAMLMGMINRGFAPPEEPKEVVQDIATYMVAPLFVVGSFASSIIQGYSNIRLPVGFGIANDMQRLAKDPTDPWKYASVAAKLKGIPFSQPQRSIKGIIALGDGETEDMRRLIWSKYALRKEQEKAAKKSSRRGRRGRRSTRRGR
ncbi:hypothetical protein LCGC14_0475070 [marine sediment metagenome]|uniref:Large polyvalent protein associated domain-containing protein n=1 Tax=marine sediment metagenome TaxID=412755 RepID=A0A0F9SG48_9ZZZZ